MTDFPVVPLHLFEKRCYFLCTSNECNFHSFPDAIAGYFHTLTSLARLCWLFFFAAIGGGIIRHLCAASDLKPAQARECHRTQDLFARRPCAAQSLLCCKC